MMSSAQPTGGGHQAVRARDDEDLEPGDAADELLLRRVADGDRRALAALYDRHSDAAFALAHEICGGGAHDVVEEAFLALWRQARGGRVGFARPRLLRITRQRALDRLHEVGRGVAGGGRGSVHRRRSVIELSDHDARTALATLAPAERHCLGLVYLDGLSVAEIAALSRQPAAAVSDRLARGRSGVRRHLAAVAATDAPGTPTAGSQ